MRASIAEGLRELGLARLRDGDEVGAHRLLYGAETLRQESELEVDETERRLGELREFARSVSYAITAAEDDAEEVEHAIVPDDPYSVTDPTDLADAIVALGSEVKALRKIEKTYANFRAELCKLGDQYRIEDEL